MIGPFPEAADLYRQRSPIHFTDRLSCPLILLQGRDDKVVPPNQAEMMFAAVRRKGLPVAYLLFDGEQHGFRRAKISNAPWMRNCIFTPGSLASIYDAVESVEIANL